MKYHRELLKFKGERGVMSRIFANFVGMRDSIRDLFGLRLILAAVSAVAIVAGACAQNRYVGFGDAEVRYVEIHGDTLTAVTPSFGLMPALYGQYRMVAQNDSIAELQSIINPETPEQAGINIDYPASVNFDSSVIKRISDHEILIIPVGLPYVKEAWLADQLAGMGIAAIYEDELLTSSDELNELESAVRRGEISVTLLSGREAYGRYGAVGIRGTLVFMKKKP